MAEKKIGSISFKRAIFLALFVLCIYYPIVLYVNVPIEQWLSSYFLIIPAIVTFVGNVVLIIAIDRIIDFSQRKFGDKFLQTFSPGAVALSILMAFFAVILSQLLFMFIFSIWSVFATPLMLEGARQLPNETSPQIWETLKRTNNGLTIIISMSVFYLILNQKANARVQRMELHSEELKKENALAQYAALKDQVSPHFLFNSLSILSSLIHTKSDLSEKFIDQLSKAYRHILEQKDNDTITLKTELDFIRSYAFLLKIRFEEMFELDISISDEDAFKYRVAPLTLQLLVENAVKHNKMSTEQPLNITVAINENLLVVRNAMHERNSTGTVASTGIGLRNIVKRYALLTHVPIMITKADKDFIVKVPLIQ